MQSPLYGERLLSRQGDATLLLVRIEDVAREQNAKNFVDQFQEVLAQHGFQDAHLGGRVYTQVRFIDMIQQELAFYIVISNLVLLVVLVWVFRTFWGVVIPLGTVLLGLLLFLGFLGWYGRPLDLMSVLFPILMLIIGMSDVIHILSKYRDELEEGRERQEAMVLALKEIGLATLLTSMTTSIGFLSLLTSRLEPIRMFGVLASVGVMIAYLTVIGFTAPLLTYFSHRQLGAAAKRSAGWNRLSEYIYLTCRRRPRTIVAVSVVVVIASVLGMRQVGTNTYLMGDIPDDSELETDFHWFEKHFSGVRDFELAILPQKGRTVMDTAVLRRTDRMVAYLEDSLPIFPKLISPLTPVRILHQAREGGAPKAYRLPEQAGEWQAILRELNRLRPLMEYLVSKDGRMGRISGRVRDLGSDSMSVVRNQVRQWSAAHIDTNVVQFRPTGAAMIIDRNNRYLTESLFKGLGIAFAIISGLMMLLFRDARMLAISLVPNVLPLLMAGGFIGFIDIELKASTAIIFTIAFGIAVDDTIHFLTRYRLLRESGYALYPSLRMTLHESGKAIVLTSILLLAGFLTLSMSDFKATYYVGILISVTVVGALLADLLLLPVILQWVYRKADRKQANARAKPRTQALSPNQKSLPSS
jgi:predicted RND superfamily exporter protein